MTMRRPLVHGQSCNRGLFFVISALGKASFRRQCGSISKKARHSPARRERKRTHGYKVDRVLVLLLLFCSALAVGAAEPGDDAAEDPPTTDDIPVRIARAEVGEWVLYRQADGGRMRLTVVEKWHDDGETGLVVMKEIIPKNKGRIRRSHERVYVSEATASLRELGEEDRVTRGEILVQGRKIRVVVIHFIQDGRLIRQSYLSPAIPVYGLVRGVDRKDNKTRVALSLIDYGYAEDIIE